MPVKIDKFAGLMPKLAPYALPDGCAQTAQNCVVTSGALKKYAAPTTTSLNLNEMTRGDSNVVVLAKPPTPKAYVNPFWYLCDSYDKNVRSNYAMFSEWFYIGAKIYQSGITDTGQTIEFPGSIATMAINNVRPTEDGLDLTCTMNSFPLSYYVGGPYKIIGPIYQISLEANGRVINGRTVTNGPATVSGRTTFTGGVYPNAFNMYSPRIPQDRIPLFHDGELYATMEIVRIDGPNFDTEYWMDGYNPSSISAITDIHVYINMNYARSSRLHVTYVTCALNSNGVEGPPSDQSPEIHVPPGAWPAMVFPRNTDANYLNIYRSSSGQNGYRMLTEKYSASTNQSNTASPAYDTQLSPIGDELPPFGAPPLGLTSIVMHPAQFAVGIVGKTVHVSDAYKPHVWPAEWSIGFQETLQQCVVAGNAVLVFSDPASSKVYALHGSNPETLSKSLLSSTALLLNPKAMARIGSDVYWVTTDGIAKSNGSSVEIITSKHYTRETWAAAALASEQMYVADNTLILGTLKFDMDEDVSAVTTLSTGAATIWRSKDYAFDQPEEMEFFRVVADAGVTIRIYNESSATVPVATQTILANANDWTAITYTTGAITWGRFWSIEVEIPAAAASTATVSSVEMVEHQVIPMTSGVLTVDASRVRHWRKFYVKFPHLGVLSGLSFSKQPTTGTMNVKVTAVDTGATETLPKTSGMITFQDPGENLMVISRTGTALTDGSVPVFRSGLWMIECGSGDGSTDAGDIHLDQMLIFARETQEVQGDTLTEINDGKIPPWLLKRYQFPDRVRLRSIAYNGTVNANAKIRLYLDGSTTPITYPSGTESLAPGDEISLRLLPRVAALEFDFNGADDDVLSVTMYCGEAQMVGNEGIFLGNSPSWTGRFFKFPDRGKFSCVSMGADYYYDDTLPDGSKSKFPVLTLYGDGVEWPGIGEGQQSYVFDGHVKKLPRAMSEAAEWELEIDSPYEIRNLVLMPLARQPVESKTIHEIAQDTGVAPWLYKRYEFPDKAIPKSFKVHSDSASVVVRFYLDGSVSPVVTYPVISGEEQSLGLNMLSSAIEFDFIDTSNASADHLINEVFIFMREGAPGETSLHLHNRIDWKDLSFNFPERVKPACVSIDASAYGSAFFSLQSGSLSWQGQIFNQYAVGIPLDRYGGAFSGANWLISATSTGAEIYGADVYFWRREKIEKSLHLVQRAGEVPAWMYTQWEMPSIQRLRSVIVRSSASVTMRVWTDESTAEALLSVPLDAPLTANNEEISLIKIPACSSFRFDFNGNDHLVSEVILFAQETVVVGDEGYHVEEPVSTRMQQLRFLEASAFALLSVQADKDATVSLYAEGNPVAAWTAVIADDKWVSLPRDLSNANNWTLDVQCAGNVRGIHLWPRRIVPVEGGTIHVIREQNAPPSWLYSIYKWIGRKKVASYRVIADEYSQNINLYFNGSGPLVKGIADNRESSDGAYYDSGTVEFNFDGSDSRAREVFIFALEEVPVPQSGLIIRGQERLSWSNMILQFPNEGSFAAARVVLEPGGTGGVLSLGDADYTYTSNDDDFIIDENETVLPARQWALNVIPSYPGVISELHLYAQNPISLANGRVIVRRDSEPWTWLNKAVVCERPVSLTCGRIYASGTVELTLWNEEGKVITSQAIDSSRPFRIPKATPTRRWRFSVKAGANVQVHEVSLATSMGGLRNG